MSLADKLKQRGHVPQQSRREPLWTGPAGEGPQGGVTNSLLQRWLVCKERFRILVVEGLRPHPQFNPRMDYGNMWHACEEAYAKDPASWNMALSDCAKKMARQFPHQQDQVSHWYQICFAEFPLYLEYWKDHHENRKAVPLLQEQPFDVKYKLPSGRIVRLRGKWDAVDSVDGKLWIQENKTKSQINIGQLTRQVGFDLQTMIYVIALKSGGLPTPKGCKSVQFNFGGVRYNVIRRSAHKSAQSMVTKIREDWNNGRISEWFARWETEISEKDIEVFKNTCLDPMLEYLCVWWDHITGTKNPYDMTLLTNGINLHWRHPFGVWNVLDEGGSSDLDEYLRTGSRVGLSVTNNLFPELQELP